ncbi:MAG: hypothetical protein PHF86_03410 [Candidatus Nanoarchaeia archaeon]|jgi:hypothetical protein|nr:hypothetical protein [Candidatus Nanoarchaeia archaeon]
MKEKIYVFYSDSGHGWLKVLKREVETSGIIKQISSFSHKKNQFLYLEEDCDASIFIKAQEAKGIKVKLKSFSTNRSSKIRNYERFLG